MTSLRVQPAGDASYGKERHEIVPAGPSYRGYTRAMKTAISIPDPLFKKAEDLARRLHLSRSQLYASALRALVDAHDETEKRRVLDELYATEPSAPPAGARRAQARIASKWEP